MKIPKGSPETANRWINNAMTKRKRKKNNQALIDTKLDIYVFIKTAVRDHFVMFVLIKIASFLVYQHMYKFNPCVVKYIL